MRLLRVLAPVMCVLAVVVTRPAPFSAFGSSAQGTIRHALGEDNIFCRIYLDPHDKFTQVESPREQMQRERASLRMTESLESAAVLSTISVNYTGFTGGTGPQAQAAFQAAVDIWKTQVASTVPIVVDAQFSDLGGGGLLGQAGSAASTNLPGATRANTWFPLPLANKLAGSNVGDATFGAGFSNIGASFNNNASVNWYFGTDGITPSGKVDFESVVLHELGHGLGFFGQVNISGANGSIGSGGNPYIYDTFTADSPIGGNFLINASVYPNPGTALATAIRSNSVYWEGASGKSANGGNRPKLYAPASFQLGSSYSHLDESTYAAGTANSLMTPQIGTAESIHAPGPIMLGMFADMGWGAPPTATCTFTLDRTTATLPAAGGTVNVALTTNVGCAWTATTGASFVSSITPGSGSNSSNVAITLAANGAVSQRVATIDIGGQALTITEFGTGPTMSLDKTLLTFGAVSSGGAITSFTSAQTVRLTQSGAGAVTWTAATNVPWLQVSPSSGSGSATLTISVAPTTSLSPTQQGNVTLTFTGAGSGAGPITTTLTLTSNSAATAPVGAFDTPTDNSTGLAGSVAVTGWAIDDVEVSRVRILRDPVAGEPAGALIYIGDGIFIDGARPDIQTAFPTRPRASRAGWGYLMLTNALPNQGNGTFKLSAFADDGEGRSTLLGTKTITCANSASLAPFGAIDTPTQGQTISGAILNAGWVLARGNQFADPPDGGVVSVFVDGNNIGAPSGWAARSDITTLFPAAQYPGVNKAVAGFGLDTSTLTNGVHTIAWVATGTPSGLTSGIGSRYFTVSNGSLYLSPSQRTAAARVIASTSALDVPAAAASRLAGSTGALGVEVDKAPADVATLAGRRGFDPESPLVSYPAADGRVTVQAEELDRVELRLAAGGRHQYTGYLRTSAGLTPLPVGSSLDAASGAFTWMPGVGFVGRYDLVFVRWNGGRMAARQDVRVVLNARGSNRIGTQTVVDLPAPTAQGRGPIVVGRTFMIAGWAADVDSAVDRGVDTVHVWAYPVSSAGQRGQAIFLGPAVYGGARPDVAAIYGARFGESGYGLAVQDLAPGAYDLCVFAFSTVKGNFAAPTILRVIVK